MPDPTPRANPDTPAAAPAAPAAPRPMIVCSVEEAIQKWGAVPNTEMDITDIDGWGDSPA